MLLINNIFELNKCILNSCYTLINYKKLTHIVKGKYNYKVKPVKCFYKEAMIKPINEIPNEFKKKLRNCSYFFLFRLLGFKPKIIKQNRFFFYFCI